MDEETLLQFVNITGADIDTARHFMEASNWQIEPAVELFFSNPSAPPPRPSSNINQQQNFGPNYGVMEEEVRPAMDQHVSRLYGGDDSPIPTQPTGRSGFSANLPSFLTDSFPGIFNRGARQQIQKEKSPNDSQLTKGSDQFKKMFRAPKEIVFNGSFQAAQHEAQTQKKWLLVNIQADDIFDCHRMNRDTWGNDLVQTIVQTFFVFWQVDKSTGEGARFNSLYHCSDYPYIAAVDPRTGENVKHWVGFMDAQKTCDELQKFCDSNSLDDGFTPVEIPMQENFPVAPEPHYQPPPQQQYQPPQPQQPSFRPPAQEDDIEDQLLRQAIEESLKQGGDVPAFTAPKEKTEEELLEEAIQASLEGMHDDNDVQVIEEDEEVPQQQQAPVITPDVAFLDQVDNYVIADTDKTTDSSLVTRVQLKLPSGKREVVKIRKNTPLTVVFALVRKKLAAETDHGDPLQVAPFNIVNVNKPLENVAEKTVTDANALGSSLMVAYE